MRPAPDDVVTRCYVDTGPIVERVVAKYAGIGWIGKNTCLINQKLGSWLFLGVILTRWNSKPDCPHRIAVALALAALTLAPRMRLIAPYQLDSNKCIAYLTIEKRGAIAEDFAPDGPAYFWLRHLSGCLSLEPESPGDGCEEFQPRPELVNPALDWLAEISAEEFRATFRGSPLNRAKRTGVRRNAVIAMGNSGRPRNLFPCSSE
jgi:epoxyqueuosine reductase